MRAGGRNRQPIHSERLYSCRVFLIYNIGQHHSFKQQNKLVSDAVSRVHPLQSNPGTLPSFYRLLNMLHLTTADLLVFDSRTGSTDSQSTGQAEAVHHASHLEKLYFDNMGAGV